MDENHEIEVANILLKLPRLILLSELRPRYSFTSTWGLKKKRSDYPKQMLIAAASTSPPSPPLLLTPCVDVCSTETPIEKIILSSSSPDTPLSFFPIELDENKPVASKKKTSVNTLKRKRDQLLEMVDDLTNRNELLKKDIEIKKQLVNEQIKENLELKSKKQKLSQGLLTQTSESYDHQQPSMKDQMVRMISELQSDGAGSSKVVHKVGPHGILDLNISAIDLERLSKRMAAEARLKRKQVCKAKNLNALCKAR